jgi:hypothetical protein
MYVKQQVLEYSIHKDEMQVLARAIDLLGKRDTAGALETLMARHATLLELEQPRLVEYDPRNDLRGLQP